MKRKIFSIVFALVLVCSFSLVAAVPAAAQGTVISSDDVEGPYVVGVPQEFSITTTSDTEYPSVLFKFVVEDAVLDDITSFEYYNAIFEGWISPSENPFGTDTWLDMMSMLEPVGNNLEGYFGPSGGFPMDAGYDVTTKFEINFNTPKTYPVTVSLETAPAPGAEITSTDFTVAVAGCVNAGTLATYGTIQEAIDAASEGDTITVAAGTYNESISVTTADLTLRSENGRDFTFIENVGSVVGAQCGFLIRGSANNFTLGGAAEQGFTFSGGTSPRLIQLNNAPSGVEISYNEVDTTGDASTGILIGAAGATGLTVDNNIFIADEDATYQDWPLIASNLSGSVLDVTVTDNEFTGSGTPDKYGAAIALENVSGTSTFSGNTISAFDRGIIIGGTTSDLGVSGNDISNCGKGVLFRPGTHAEMEDNTFANNIYNIYHAAEILTGGSSFYGNIQDAINAASEGDTIQVYAGIYREYLHITTDGLTIEGAGIDQSIIDLDGLTPYWHYPGNKSYASRAGVLISGYLSSGTLAEVVENVTFKGFTVKNAGLNPPITATGTHTGAENPTVLTDSTKSWTPGALIGQWVHNYGDKDPADWKPARSYGQITANTLNTVTVASLSGGVENDWDTGDPYIITSYESFYDGWGDGQEDIPGIGIANGKNIRIQYCKAENNGKYGISAGKARKTSLTQSENVTIDNCVAVDNADNGISVGDHIGTVAITNNTCTNNGSLHTADPTREYQGTGIQVTGSDSKKVMSGTISGNTCRDSFIGIHMAKYSDGVTVEDNTVTGCNRDQDGAGIFFYHDNHPEWCQNHIIRNNIVTGNIRGIVAYYASYCTIEGNTITTDSGVFPEGQAAIKIDGGNNIEVKDNTISSCDGVGIRVTNTWNDVPSFENTFTGNTITGAKFAGVRITKGARDNIFTYNTITGTIVLTRGAGEDEVTQGDGVLIEEAAGTGNVFHWNNIYGNAGDGMENQVTTTIVDATNNWWGDETGPKHATLNTGAQGDAVSDNVLFSPWLYKTQENFVTDAPCYAGSVVLDNEATLVDTTSHAGGWNSFSTPVTLDSSADNISELLALTAGSNLSIVRAQRFDLASQEWIELVMGGELTGEDYQIKPGEGFFIQVSTKGSLPILCSTNPTSPPRTDLVAGWNLVGLSNFEWMDVADALNNVSYSVVLSASPPNATSWSVPPDAASTFMELGEAYWLAMGQPGILFGHTTTPVADDLTWELNHEIRR